MHDQGVIEGLSGQSLSCRTRTVFGHSFFYDLVCFDNYPSSPLRFQVKVVEDRTMPDYPWAVDIGRSLNGFEAVAELDMSPRSAKLGQRRPAFLRLSHAATAQSQRMEVMCVVLLSKWQ
jgi:hypothetical protein